MLRNRRTIRRHYSNVDPYPPRAVQINVIEDRVPLYNNDDRDNDNIASFDDQDQGGCSEGAYIIKQKFTRITGRFLEDPLL